ncbi:MAG: hypothetical protein ACLQU2_22815, partial [Candidatus Binataceae bacterium]
LLAIKWLPTSPQAGFLTHSQSLWTLSATLPIACQTTQSLSLVRVPGQGEGINQILARHFGIGLSSCKTVFRQSLVEREQEGVAHN